MSEYHANTPIIYLKSLFISTQSNKLNTKQNIKLHPGKRPMSHIAHEQTHLKKNQKNPTQMIYPNKRLMHG